MTTSKPALHYSMLAMLSKCGEMARLRYVEGRKSPPGVALIVGTAVHKAAEMDLVRKMETGAGAPREEVMERAADALDATWSGEDPLLDDEERGRGVSIVKAEAKDKAVALSALHSDAVTPLLQPIAVERKMRLVLDGFPFDLEGAIDVEEADTIRDRKTASKSPSGGEADGHVQLDTYAMMRETIDGKAARFVALDYLVALKTPKYAPIVARAPVDHTSTLRRIERAAHVFQSGAFYPVDPSGPSGWTCASKWCGFHDSICEFGARRKRSFAVNRNTERD